MPESLRTLALVVREPTPGDFLWVIQEGQPDSAYFDHQVARAAEPFPTYIQALEAGTEALKALAAHDLRRGPRGFADDDEFRDEVSWNITAINTADEIDEEYVYLEIMAQKIQGEEPTQVVETHVFFYRKDKARKMAELFADTAKRVEGNKRKH